MVERHLDDPFHVGCRYPEKVHPVSCDLASDEFIEWHPDVELTQADLDSHLPQACNADQRAVIRIASRAGLLNLESPATNHSNV